MRRKKVKIKNIVINTKLFKSCYVIKQHYIFLYTIFIIQYDNIYEIKENKKDNNLKAQNLITSTRIRVPNNTKIYQPKVEIHEKYEKKSTKNGERERERSPYVCRKTMYKTGKRIVNLQ